MAQQQQHHHAAVDDLQNLLVKASNDLSVVQHKLEKEFQNTYPDNANPLMLVSRIKKIQDDLLSLKEQCHELLAAKQYDGASDSAVFHVEARKKTIVCFFTENPNCLMERFFSGHSIGIEDLIDKARTTLVGNRSLLQRMQASCGLPLTGDSDDLAFKNLNQIIDEWTIQIRQKTGDEKHDSDSEDINQLLFSAIVQNS